MIRCVRLSDAKDIQRIYKFYVENTSVSFEYNAPDEEEICKRISDCTKKYPWIVMEENGKIIGYAYAHGYRVREAYSWNAEVSIYIDKNFLHSGKGRELYNVLIKILKIQGYCSAFVLVNSSNIRSIKFHKKIGFREISEEKNVGYKFGEWHNLIIMRKNLTDKFPEIPNEIIPWRSAFLKIIFDYREANDEKNKT